MAYSNSAERLRALGERLPRPLMTFMPGASPAELPIPKADLVALGFRIVAVPLLPLLALHKAVRQYYGSLAQGVPDALLGKEFERSWRCSGRRSTCRACSRSNAARWVDRPTAG